MQNVCIILTDKQILNPLQFNFLVDTLLKWAVKLRKGVFPLTELPPGHNEHQISIHSFILRFYFDIMGLFLFPLILSAVVSDAEVTDIVNSNNQAAKITSTTLHCLVDVHCIYCTAEILVKTCFSN